MDKTFATFSLMIYWQQLIDDSVNKVLRNLSISRFCTSHACHKKCVCDSDCVPSKSFHCMMP